ncbi:MAG: hemerythrin family protein [Eubacterium sp.]|nr:hemerythrin family protein [Eubacterium sp.]
MFQFTEDCMIGVAEIDDQHSRLFDLMNHGMDLARNDYVGDRYAAIKDMLDELDDYAEQHFAHEENYMEQIRDPELILQRNQHMIFRDKIRAWSFTDIDDPDQQRQLLAELMEYLARWLYHHIISSDAMIGKLPPLEEWMLKENPCEFLDEYRTGIPFVDEEHEELFRITDRANKCLYNDFAFGNGYDEILDILGELKDYTQRHFKDEESYMERIQYDGLPAQKRAHASFIERLENIDLDAVDGDPKVYLESLIEFLLGWLINHILYTDKKIPLE